MRCGNSAPCRSNQGVSTACLSTNLTRRFRITHPFHPLFSREYELVEFRRAWGRDRVVFYDENENLITVPVSWTNLAQEADPFVVLSEERAYFRPSDLLALVDLIKELKS